MSLASLVCPVALAVLLLGSRAAAQTDFDVENRSWNGGSELRAALEGAGLRVESPRALDVDELDPEDALLVLHPTRPLPLAALSRFMRHGGRVGLADDFGSGHELFGTYGMKAADVDRAQATLFRGNPNVLLAARRSDHALTQDVPALVTNHPRVLEHRELFPLFAFARGQSLVLVGAVGSGRLVAIGDASVFINNMMEFAGNRRFAANLGAYLSPDPAHRLFLVGPATRLLGAGASEGVLAAAKSLLSRLGHLEAPPMVLTVAAVMIVALLLVIVATSLPRRSPYQARRVLPPPVPAGGLEGRVETVLAQPKNLFSALMLYKFELEAAIGRQMGRSAGLVLREVVERFVRLGVAPQRVEEMRTLLLELDDFERREGLPAGAPKVSARRFCSFVERGNRVLATLADHRGTGNS